MYDGGRFRDTKQIWRNTDGRTESRRTWNERARGCGGKNVKEIEENMRRRRRKDGEETILTPLK